MAEIMSGYLSSGRAIADWHLEQMQKGHSQARWCFRNGFIGDGKEWIRQARRALRNYRYYRAKVIL